jgi:hypothetical protein
MPLWKAGVLYIAAALVSYQASYWLMFYVGRLVARVAIDAGLVTI